MSTKYKGNKKEVRALDAFIKLMRASDSVISRLNPHLAAEGLTTSQFGALETIYHIGPLLQCELAKKLLKSGGNITMVVDNLEKRGLVERRRQKADRRQVEIHLTGEGRALISEMFPRQAAVIAEEMDVLTEDEQEELARICRKLGLKSRT